MPIHLLRRALAAVLAALSLAAQAQVNKCPQPDGSVSYQTAPCGSGSDTPPAAHPTAAQLNAAERAQAQLKSASKPAADAYANKVDARPRAAGPLKPSVASPLPDNMRIVSEEDRRRACTIALNNEAVLNAPGGKAYSFDKDGNRSDVLDGDRAALLATARRNEAKYCK